MSECFKTDVRTIQRGCGSSGEVIEETKRQQTCAEQQQHLHAQVLVVGHLQPDKLAGDLQHLLTLVRHVGQLHPGPGRGTAQHNKLIIVRC